MWERNVARRVNEKEIYLEYVILEHAPGPAISIVVRSQIKFARDYYNNFSKDSKSFVYISHILVFFRNYGGLGVFHWI